MKSGFTLIELLAVIVILAIIAIITIVSMGDILSTSKDSLHDSQIKIIEKAAKQYDVTTGIGESNCINIETLVDTGFLESKKVLDPKTREELPGSVKVEKEGNKEPSYIYQSTVCAE